jgi:peptidoglycan hydrolase-like protein with peptidoglycan-binding domain
LFQSTLKSANNQWNRHGDNMKIGISKSVGRNGINNKDDVIFVQSALNAHAKKHTYTTPLKVDGLCGEKTIQAISVFQKNSAGIAVPDGRVDPNGKTLRYLTMVPATKTATSRTSGAQKLNEVYVTYSSNIKESRRVVSTYSINVIKLALMQCGMTHAVITSTLRTPEDQAEIMYDNAQINFDKQKSLYGKNGDDVLEVYKDNKNKTKDEVVKLMKEKIESLLKKDKKVSNHCIAMDDFKALNTFDIGLNSTRAKTKNFSKEKLTKAFTELKQQGYIKNFIDETMKSNSCWHLEISPNAKNISIYRKESMLLPSTSTTSRYV